MWNGRQGHGGLGIKLVYELFSCHTGCIGQAHEIIIINYSKKESYLLGINFQGFHVERARSSWKL